MATTSWPFRPPLALSPAALGGTLALEQRLVFEHGQRSDTVDALVEADAHVVRIVLHRQGQVLLRLAWDGKELQQERAEQLPDTLSAQRVLADLQLVYWPAEAINQALASQIIDYSLGKPIRTAKLQAILHGRDQRELGKTVQAPGLRYGDVIFHLEILDLAGEIDVKTGGIKCLNLGRAALTSQQRLPGVFRIMAQRGNRA